MRRNPLRPRQPQKLRPLRAPLTYVRICNRFSDGSGAETKFTELGNVYFSIPGTVASFAEVTTAIFAVFGLKPRAPERERFERANATYARLSQERTDLLTASERFKEEAPTPDQCGPNRDQVEGLESNPPALQLRRLAKAEPHRPRTGGKVGRRQTRKPSPCKEEIEE